MSNEKTNWTQSRPLVGKTIKAVDFTEAYNEGNTLRTAQGLSNPVWNPAPATDGSVSVEHMERIRLVSACVKYGSLTNPYTDSPVTSATNVRALHMEEVRQVIDDARNNARCGNQCHSSCATACSQMCYTACTATCVKGCNASCMTPCVSNCTGCSSCWWWLGGNCGACNVNCTGGCADQNCITGCYTNCNAYCSTACSSFCSTSCSTSACVNNCYTGCSVSCRSGCANSQRLGSDAASY